MPASSGAGAPARPGVTRPLSPEPAVSSLIQALLDTTRSGTAGARDQGLKLQAGSLVRTFYGSTYQPAWTVPADSTTPGARAALTVLAGAAAHGLPPEGYHTPLLRGLRDSLFRRVVPERRPWQQARLEVYLTDAVLRFMRDVSRGRLRPYTLSAAETAAGQSRQPALELRAALQAASPTGAVPAAMLAGQPAHREYRQLQQALARWLARPVAPDSVNGHRRQYEQAALNLERWRWDALPADSAYIFINIPAYELQLVAQDSVQRRHRVIVGKPETPTPTLSSRISHFTLAPDWYVPRSIATREMLPHLWADPGYLARNGLTLYDARGRPLDATRINWHQVTARNFSYVIRQSAGCDNALGNIVFRFANPYAVYLHDTPQRQLFNRSTRALSHGCIRVEQPLVLAAYLLRREHRQVELPTEAECARQPRPHDVRLLRPLPLHVRYATCVAENGRLRFLPDIYRRDEALRRALFPAGG
ncbi:L,D-transpeptidase family protein [Hymenobacter lutimineralis]|uniref:L,D-transpeptidase family protein n=1 Tax=Hymenobacter lutimineralis TaxID=2606448 RepID=A0A5D6UX35_9BACT|nr:MULTISPECIES: L,D-transpeptidase family protein [Hymenobacter]QIX63270.1 L,D-transpeptidase family protein [Hymenobacter sp. BT18]TYZ08063.1 L,D-transpeptidase family protein [Hymenobacter lutimineralis]